MSRSLIAAAAGFALLPTPALADSHYIGAISMYLCDGGEDLCSSGLIFDYVINGLRGPFSADFTFDVVSHFPNIPDNWPLVKSAVTVGSSESDYDHVSVSFRDPDGHAIGMTRPSGSPNEFIQWALTPYATGYDIEVSGVSLVAALRVQGSFSAFDLGPVVVPEPSTWAMLGLGFAALALAASTRTAPAHRRGAQSSRSPRSGVAGASSA